MDLFFCPFQSPFPTSLESSLKKGLEAVLSRLVSDYRAIFAIEEEENYSGSQQFAVDHEHRKRHEEEDDCPEEIKLM